MRVYGLAMNPADLDAIEKMLRVTYLAPGIADAFAKLRKERDALRLDAAEFRSELMNIGHAKRFHRDHFDDDTSFADWAQRRARFALGELNAATEAAK